MRLMAQSEGLKGSMDGLRLRLSPLQFSAKGMHLNSYHEYT